MREQPKVIVGGGSAYPRIFDFRPHARDRRQGGRVPDGGHGALRRAGRGRRASLAGAARARRDDDHAQDAARTARRPDPVHSRSLPQASTAASSPASRAARWCTSSRPRRWPSRRRCSPSFAAYAAQIVANAKVLADGAGGRGLPHHLRRHGHAPDAGRCLPEGHSGQRGGERAARGRHHGEQERDSVRHQSADEAERHPHRHAGADHARHEGAGDEARSPAGSRRRSRSATTRRRWRRFAARCWSWRSSSRSTAGCARASPLLRNTNFVLFHSALEPSSADVVNPAVLMAECTLAEAVRA